MLVLKCKIEFRNKDTKKIVSFNYVHSVEVKTSIRNLTDTATITLPKKVSWRGKPITDFIKRGDEVSVKTWYDGYEPNNIFNGFVTSVSAEMPIKIQCEDQMWQLKQTTVKPERYKKFDINNFVSKYLPSIKTNITNTANFGEVIIQNETTMAQVFDYLMSNYPIHIFFIKNVLTGLLNTTATENGAKFVSFEFGRNIISDNIKYQRAEDVKVYIHAKSILADNTKLEVFYPSDKKGAVRTFHNSSLKTKKELEDYASQKYQEYNVDKCIGSITAFGIPFVEKGDKIKLFDKVNPERDNKTFVADGVDYTFSASGYRQIIHLGDQYKR